MKQVERLPLNAVHDFAGQIASIDRPVVLAGAALHWPAMSELTLEELQRSLGSARIPVRDSDDGLAELFGPRQQRGQPRRMMQLAAYIDLITKETPGPDKPRPPYAGNIDIVNDPAVSQKLSGLLGRCRFPDWLPPNSRDEYRLWIAAAGQRSATHNDPYHNLNAQIAGRKHFLLFAPGQHEHLYPVFCHIGLWASPVDLHRPDLQKYPKIESAEAFECELVEGDILYLPRFWWHFANATTACVNVNRWIFNQDQESRWWHQQPEARKFIAYETLLESLRRGFHSLPADAQQMRRAQFEEIESDLIRLMARESMAS